MHKASVEETLKLKRLHVDQWSIREQLALASSVQRSGDQNWASVSRAIKPFGEKDRPNDWFSQKNCALQYEKLLENVETPKRRRGDKGEESKPVTPGELIVEKLRSQRLEELQGMMDLLKRQYRKAKQDVVDLSSGKSDDRLDQIDAEIDLELKQEEEKKKKYEIWLKEREEKINEIQRAWRPLTFIRKKTPNIMESSASSDAEVSQDSVLSENVASDQPAEEEQKRATATPTSPLLTHLLKSPASTSQQPSILHSAIMSHRPAASSPTITSLLASSAPTKTPFSPGLSNLVTSAVASAPTEQPVVSTVPSTGAPTLSMLLELPPSVPGTPLPELPATSEPAEPVEVKAETPLVRPPAPTELLQSTVESSIEFEKQFQNFDKNAVDSSKGNVLEELPQDVVELIEEVEEAAEAKKQQGELFLSSQLPPPVQVQPEPVEPKPEPIIEPIAQPSTSEVKTPEEQPTPPEPVEPAEPIPVMEVDATDTPVKEEKGETQEVEAMEVEDIEVVPKEVAPAEPAKPEVAPVVEEVKEEIVEKEPPKAPEPTKKPEPVKEVEDEKESELEESSDDDYKPRPVNITTYPARTKRSMMRRSAPLQSTTDESTPNSPVSVEEDKNKSWKKAMLLIWDRIAAHKNASLFLKPITNEQVPGYRNIVLRPMDLLSIKRGIETGSIASAEAFQRDLRLVFLNAVMFNPANHDVALLALEMQKDSLEEFQVYAAAHESRTFKRETREGSRRHDPPEDTPVKRKFSTLISESSDDDGESTS